MLEEAVVGIAQWLPTPGRSEENLNAALSFVAELGRAGCDVIVLPELWPSGFDWLSLTEDVRSAAEPLDGPRTRALARAARSTHAWLCAGTVPELVGGTVYNTLLLFDRTGELRARHRKTHLYEPLGESKAVAPGNEITICRHRGLRRDWSIDLLRGRFSRGRPSDGAARRPRRAASFSL